MNKDQEQTLYAYIVLPYVLKVLKLDYKNIREKQFGTKYVLSDFVEQVTEAVQTNLNAVKREIYSKHHMKVRELGQSNGKIRYDWQTPNDSGDLYFTPEQLKELTRDMMSEYFFGHLSIDFEPKDNYLWELD
ncbi:hypothetical protein KO561_12965 [Radiobacillus kanasensis]|uniref:hypothetical protein n=1 Tax=Radiobacillus kanasensis TaxID=2844358 RepID=UPI001E5C9D88|nr:hypothetical protein [Radiobacillus kanasensis]UFT98113.1 hypothetical protein KO561_12965 [Radiobacillus kanasensis]